MDLQPEVEPSLTSLHIIEQVSIVLIMASTKVLYQFVTYASCEILDSAIGWQYRQEVDLSLILCQKF